MEIVAKSESVKSELSFSKAFILPKTIRRRRDSNWFYRTQCEPFVFPAWKKKYQIWTLNVLPKFSFLIWFVHLLHWSSDWHCKLRPISKTGNAFALQCASMQNLWSTHFVEPYTGTKCSMWGRTVWMCIQSGSLSMISERKSALFIFFFMQFFRVG